MNPPNNAIQAPRGNQKDEGEQPQSTATEALNSAAILTEAWFNKSQESGTVHPPLNCTVDEDAAAPDVSVAALPAIPPDGNQVQDRNLDSRDEGKMIVEGVEQQQQHSQGADARADTSQVQLPLPAFAFPLKPSYASADITAASSTKRRSTSFEGSNNGDGDEEEVRQNQLHFTDYENSDTNKINITTNSNNLSSSKLQQQQLLEQQRKQTKLTPADHRVIISNALQITSHSERDAALLTALRGCAKELEEAEDDHDRATKRLKSAKEMFDWAAGALSGYAKDIEPKCEKLVKRGRKKKGEKKDEEEEKTDGVGGGGVIVGASLGGGTGVGTGDGVVGEEDLRRFVPPDEGPLLPPMVAIRGGGLTEQQIPIHKDEFYIRLVGRPFAELSTFTPPLHLANLKTRAQLDEYIFIAKHWDTGLPEEGVDVLTFRRRNKTFYTKMLVSNENIGRRTGHHLRTLAGGENKEVFCRYGKNGESLMYVALEDLYDAIFEIHTLKGHRSWAGCKKIANLKYANVPQEHLRQFIESCPVCFEKKGVGYKKKRGRKPS